MRIISCNVNGIRAAARKGFFEWLSKQDADVVCLQEVRAQTGDIQDEVYWPSGYQVEYLPAVKKGYSGVAIYTKQKPDEIITTFGHALADEEGRYLCARYDDLFVGSLYLPSGTSGDERQTIKYDMMAAFEKYMDACQKSGGRYIFCGDWNIAHTQKDIKNWKANQKNSGFLPEERAWLDTLFGPKTWVDAFRVLNQEADQYSWWSQRGRARENNVGWRIDYQIISSNLKNTLQGVAIDSKERFSDHAPLVFDYHL
ncbi:MAG: exodeoxyribonuclease III [Legionellales bacterium]|nr:exodeoxyribonuclease III [Legionellales bacterium]|tara:strand:+ start:856 stop:1623 length:768 start_codon:yes stop_codon:yes gene_type:complete